MSQKGDYGTDKMPVSIGSQKDKPKFDKASAKAMQQIKEKAVNEQQTIKK